ncbi:Eukaryotic translation initiation factor 3 subunit a protein [Heracleum sosnowskyi]|nr:Eukaryotic translation initiation factor 3 subunit a protein [Heracleum sosnowskyi]
MAASIANTKVIAHSRSISLPSRSHPLTATVEEHLCRLRTPEEASSSTISKFNKLSALQDLYECVEDLLQLPSAQQDQLISGEDILCGSIRLLDLCSTSKDAISLVRASVQDLESSLRRKETDVSSKTGSYLICKKKANKMVSKCFAGSKKSKINKSIETPAIVSLLREVEEVSITVFESIFSSICPAKEASKQNKWSKVFKSSKTSGITGTQEVQKCLKALDMNMQECEDKLDCLVRSLIKTRVSILNVLNH